MTVNYRLSYYTASAESELFTPSIEDNIPAKKGPQPN